MNSVGFSPVNLAMAATFESERSQTFGATPTLETQAQLEAVAEQFEAIFVKSILSSARAAELSDPLLNTEGEETFTQMLDAAYADAMAQKESLGIADAIVRQFQDRVRNGDAE